MWESDTELLHSDQVQQHFIISRNKHLSYSEVIKLWQHNADFREFFVSLLAGAPFSAYFWETPPVTHATTKQDFQFVLVNSPELAGVTAEPGSFEVYFQSTHASEGIVTFPNLGKDAMLVVPCPDKSAPAYPHIAAFTRSAPEAQQHALWKRVGETLALELGEQAIWLSTTGLGVYWLHVRLDSIPKYYSYTPYKLFNA